MDTMEKKLDGNYTRIPQAVWNKSRRQHPTKQQIYGHRPPITKTIQVRRSRHAGNYWRCKDELASYVLLWTLSRGRANIGRAARIYIQQLYAYTGCILEDPPEAMDNRDERRERGSGRSVLAARHDDDDDDFFECYIIILLTLRKKKVIELCILELYNLLLYPYFSQVKCSIKLLNKKKSYFRLFLNIVLISLIYIYIYIYSFHLTNQYITSPLYYDDFAYGISNWFQIFQEIIWFQVINNA